MSDELIHRN
jgi:hypothetical protein